MGQSPCVRARPSSTPRFRPTAAVPPAPSAPTQQPFEVLCRSNPQRLAVDLRQTAQAEPAQPVPVLGLPEEGLDPHLPLPERLQVGRSALIAADLIPIGLIEVPVEPPARRTVRASAAAGTRRTSRRAPGRSYTSDIVVAPEAQQRTVGTRVHMPYRVVREIAMKETTQKAWLSPIPNVFGSRRLVEQRQRLVACTSHASAASAALRDLQRCYRRRGGVLPVL